MGSARLATQYVPLVSKGVRYIPAGETTFNRDDHLFAYFQIDVPETTREAPVGIQAHLRIIDANSSDLVKDFPAVDAASYEQGGSASIPIGREIPIANLTKGQYRLEVQTSDASGRETTWHAVTFSIK